MSTDQFRNSLNTTQIFFCTTMTTLTSQRRCFGYPAAWSPQAPTTSRPPAHRWGASSPEGPNRRRRRRRSLGPARGPREMRCTRSRRTPAVCRGPPPSPPQWSLRNKEEPVSRPCCWEIAQVENKADGMEKSAANHQQVAKTLKKVYLQTPPKAQRTRTYGFSSV